MTPGRWYVRGSDDVHDYVALSFSFGPGVGFCRTCVTVHSRPIGQDWHVEGESVDYMLCGVKVDLDDCEVRVRPAKNVCAKCARIAAEMEEKA